MRKTIYSILALSILLSCFFFYSSNRSRRIVELEMKYKRMGCSLYHERVLENAPQWVQALNYKLFGKAFAEFEACYNLSQDQLEEVVGFTKLTEVDLSYTKGLDLKALSQLKLKKLSLYLSQVKSPEVLKEFDLNYLVLAGSNITDFSLILHMKNLKTLLVSGISPGKHAWIKEHLPQCEIRITSIDE